MRNADVERFKLIAYPFVIEEDRECTLWLPREGLRREDAERLKNYIDSLVIEHIHA